MFSEKQIEKIKVFLNNPYNIKRIRLGMALHFQKQKEILENMYSPEEIQKIMEEIKET